MTKRKYRTDEEWLSLIQECRLSGLTDKQWCETHQICPSNFYYQIQKFRKRACEIPESHSKTTLTAQNRKLFKLHLNSRLYRNRTSSVLSIKGRKGRCSNSCADQWLSDRNHKCSVRKCNLSYSVSAASPVLGDLSGVSKIYLITGRTDMRKSFDGLMAIIRDKYELDPYANALYLFCGRDKRKIKALHFDKDGFVLLQKRLDGSGRFQWPTNASEARQLTRQQFRWLTEGLSIDQPKAIHAGDKRKDF